MLKILQILKNKTHQIKHIKQLIIIPTHKFSRTKKQAFRPHQSDNKNLSWRHKMTTIRRLINNCTNSDKQQAFQLLDREFYDNMYNEKAMNQLTKWKCSVGYYFRDYPDIVMSLQNFAILAASHVDHSDLFIKRALLEILSNHEALKKTLYKYDKSSYRKTFISLYIRSLVDITQWQFNQGQKKLLNLINAPLNQLLGIKKSQLLQQFKEQQIQQQLLSPKQKRPYQLNFKQKVLINLLCLNMFLNEQSSTKSRRQPMALYNKIRNKEKIQAQDLVLTDYEQFLNIWVSSLYNRPMQWTDIAQAEKLPYFKYIYLLAQNQYIAKNHSKSIQILEQLPRNYPLRHFLQISRLYDIKDYQGQQKLFTTIQQQINQKKSPFYKLPEFDFVFYNILQIMNKQEIKTLEGKNQEKQVFAKHLQNQLTKFRYNFNMQPNVSASKGIPFYYLDIPFNQFLVYDKLSKIFL